MAGFVRSACPTSRSSTSSASRRVRRGRHHRGRAHRGDGRPPDRRLLLPQDETEPPIGVQLQRNRSPRRHHRAGLPDVSDDRHDHLRHRRARQLVRRPTPPPPANQRPLTPTRRPRSRHTSTSRLTPFKPASNVSVTRRCVGHGRMMRSNLRLRTRSAQPTHQTPAAQDFALLSVE